MVQLPTLTLSAVTRALGVGETRVRQLDPLLAPIRDSSGRRLYSFDCVAGVRDARRARGKGVR